VAFVALASLNDPTLLAATVGDALGVEHGPTRTHLQSLVEHLGSHPLTLVLDNLEQLTEAAADIAAMLRSCPGLSVVATSRVPLRIAGEVQYVVRALDANGDDLADRPAVRLFVARAVTSGLGAVHGADELAPVAELCDRLDGLPLAIELAAARSRVVAPVDMLRHLDQVLDLLSVGRSDAPEHHRSMRAALEWSFRLLPPAAQEALATLGVFATSASNEAAMAVWGLPVDAAPTFYDLVQTLADAHLISVDRTAVEGIRIDMFETTRQFARQKLEGSDGAELARRRFTQWALGLVERAEPGLTGSDQLRWLELLDRELPNLRAAARRLVERGVDDDIDTALRLVAGLQRFWDIRARWHEGAAWLADALARPGGSAAVRGKAQKALGVMNRCLGNLDVAEAELERAVALFASAGDERGVASCSNNRGVIALDRADYARAASMFRQALELCARHHDEPLEAIVLNNLALTMTQIGELREALRLCRRSRQLLAAHGNVSAMSWVEDNLASVLTAGGHPRWAVPIHQRAIRQRLALGDENGFAWSLEALAAAWTGTGETELAGRALGFVAAQRRRLGAVPVPFLTAMTARRSDALVACVGADRFAELWDEGAALDPAVVRAWFTG